MYRQNEPWRATAEDVRGQLRRVHGRPALTRDEDSARMMRRSLDGSCNSARTLARFVERMSPTEVEALRVAVRERLDGQNTEAKRTGPGERVSRAAPWPLVIGMRHESGRDPALIGSWHHLWHEMADYSWGISRSQGRPSC